MPTQPFNIKCCNLACKNERARLSAKCVEHGGLNTRTVQRTEKRASFNAMYNTAAWQKKRALQLSKQPLCQSCLSLGKVKGANHVDHVFSWSSINMDAFYRNIMQSLCHECHSSKTLLERDNIYRHYNVGSSAYIDYKITDYNYILMNQGDREMTIG